MRANAASSIASPSSIDASMPRWIAESAAASVSGGLVASSFASAIASRRRSASATTRLIKPKLAASFDVNTRPVRINSIAAFRPTLRGKR